MSTNTATASPSPSASGTPVKFDVTLRPTYTKTNKVNKGGNSVYGMSILEGYTKVNDTTVHVRMLGTVDTTDGSGPLGGFLEMVWSDGTVLGMRQDGNTTSSGSSTTDFNANLTVIGGSGKAVGTTGTGNLTGTRKGSTTSSVSVNVELNLTGAPELITGDPTSADNAPKQSYSATIAP